MAFSEVTFVNGLGFKMRGESAVIYCHKIYGHPRFCNADFDL
ncbi:hypothetical protein Y11_00201 [Yersinia enterocolitica subsp. palearctica Y11]|uniref:Uncharacterized protein n=1 Tax=Yersinia enterocolitica subsp. palearctica serotype O:3 (strain DSM 13030 / CIP 106945 / Y11) TaxID=930944 RepID=A0A0H3NT14_YERE1|nr:hypothetical protein Y11_00201 [Yersinia enterocolitica subsp. palearctica Y11]CCO67173.1 hypothetical protein D322_277 [Yersinia enterocolitica IP 10393]